MRNKFTALACIALRVICAPAYRRFNESLYHPKPSQDRLLRRIIADIARTEYGKQFGVRINDSYEEFIAKVPVATYQTLQHWIDLQINEKHKAIVSPHRIVHVEPTSGSTGARKSIPYTNKLLHSFTNMFSIWAFDLLRTTQLQTGKIFISVSGGNPQNSGFNNDAQYLNEPLRTLVAPFLVLPPHLNDDSNFLFELALTLLAEEKLEIISIWSPTYLLTVLAFIEENGSIIQKSLKREIPALANERIDWQTVFPNLKLISCWDQGWAQESANRLRNKFPDVRVQGKGLLATEAPITVPISSVKGSVPLLDEVFFEFEDSKHQIKRIHEVERNKRYQLIITQRAGLTRYRLNDLVEVEKFYKSAPVLKFIARVGSTDLAGEKLDETFVSDVLSPLLFNLEFVLLPRNMSGNGYTLLVDKLEQLKNQSDLFSSPKPEVALGALSEQVDNALRRSYHYNLARQQNQLKCVQAVVVPELSKILLKFNLASGIKFGDIKGTKLIVDQSKAQRLLDFLFSVKPLGEID